MLLLCRIQLQPGQRWWQPFDQPSPPVLRIVDSSVIASSTKQATGHHGVHGAAAERASIPASLNRLFATRQAPRAQPALIAVRALNASCATVRRRLCTYAMPVSSCCSGVRDGRIRGSVPESGRSANSILDHHPSSPCYGIAARASHTPAR